MAHAHARRDPRLSATLSPVESSEMLHGDEVGEGEAVMLDEASPKKLIGENHS